MIWSLLKTLFVLLPEVWKAIREGRIKSAAKDEVLNALSVTHTRRIMAAHKARQAAPTDPDIEYLRAADRLYDRSKS